MQDTTLGTDDPGGEPYLLDFGLATAITSVGDDLNSITNMTMTGQFVGLLPWASPEQAEGVPEKIDVRTSIHWELFCITY